MGTEIAALRSHKSLLKHCLEKKIDTVLILEDDIDFHPNFQTALAYAMKELPEDWDCLHLGGYSPEFGLKNYSPLLYRCLQSWGGYGYIVRLKAIPKLLQTIEPEKTQVDTYYTKIMPELQWFKTKEMLVKHLPGYSDIMQREVDYKILY